MSILSVDPATMEAGPYEGMSPAEIARERERQHAEALARARAMGRKYSDEQPRDEQGRWSEQGGGGDAWVDRRGEPVRVEWHTDPKNPERQITNRIENRAYTMERLPNHDRFALGYYDYGRIMHGQWLGMGWAADQAEAEQRIADEEEWTRGKSRKYSEDQPRDDQGRWTSGGGGGSEVPAGYPENATRFWPPAVDLAGQYERFEDFKHDYQLNNYHGTYWHLTNDPEFTVSSTYEPTEASSLAFAPGGETEHGALMVTTDVGNWQEELGGTRAYAAEITLPDAKPGVDFRDTTRGFGQEIYVSSPEKAQIVQVVSIEEAIRINDEMYAGGGLPQNDEELRQVWDLAHPSRKSFGDPGNTQERVEGGRFGPAQGTTVSEGDGTTTAVSPGAILITGERSEVARQIVEHLAPQPQPAMNTEARHWDYNLAVANQVRSPSPLYESQVREAVAGVQSRFSEMVGLLGDAAPVYITAVGKMASPAGPGDVGGDPHLNGEFLQGTNVIVMYDHTQFLPEGKSPLPTTDTQAPVPDAYISCQSISDIATHEFAHDVWFNGLAEETQREFGRLFIQYDRGIMEEASTPPREQITYYAGNNTWELFAESFTVVSDPKYDRAAYESRVGDTGMAVLDYVQGVIENPEAHWR